MLMINDESTQDHRASRRSMLTAGTLALGGLTMADMFRQQAAAGTNSSRPKSVVMIHMSGGPSHLDMYDMKPQAPVEYRGEFQPIQTNVPGMEICELMPRQAQIADKFTILRGAQIANLHSGNMFYSGFPWQEEPRASIPGEARRPALGSVVSRLRPGGKGIPPYVSIENAYDWERSYYLGPEHEPVRVGSSNHREAIENMGPQGDLSPVRRDSRHSLLQDFERVRRRLELGNMATGIDRFQQKALDILLSSKIRDAFDLEKESRESRLRFGESTYSYGPHPGRSLLLARRLIEAGVSVVTVCFHGWDTHRSNFPALREMLPVVDQAVHAFVVDLVDRGMLDDVMIVMGGEFGRTPRIGDTTPDGRGHWPDAGFLWVAGGGLQTGQIIGATDARGEAVIGRPIGMKQVLATIYKKLGIATGTTFPDHNGRPQMILDTDAAVHELL